jgi:hypothetical protein
VIDELEKEPVNFEQRSFYYILNGTVKVYAQKTKTKLA